MSSIVRRTTTKLDGNHLVLNLIEYDDASCWAAVVFSVDAKPESPSAVTVMIQRQKSVELAVAAIARDFSTFAARTLASLPSIGRLEEPDEDEEKIA